MNARAAKGFTLIELLIVVAVIGIIAAIGIPGLLRCRIAGNEASAIGSLRAINSGEVAYASSCGNGGYATSLEDLYSPPAGGTAYISADLKTTDVVKSGYRLRVQAGSTAAAVSPTTATCNSTASQSTYFAKAEPATFNGTGSRSFATSTNGTIFERVNSATAYADPIPSTATPLQ